MKYIAKITGLLLTLVLLLAGIYTKALAQNSTGSMKFDSLKAAKDIADGNKLYINALAKGDSTALSNLYTKDARILLDGEPTTSGHAAVLHFYSEMVRNGVTKFNYVTTGVWGSDNNLVLEDGTLTFALASGKIVAKGRYLLVWKNEDGELRIFRDTFFSDPK